MGISRTLDTGLSISQGSCLRGPHVENPLNSLQAGSIGNYIYIYGTTKGVIKGNTRSLDYDSFGEPEPELQPRLGPFLTV